MSMVIAWFNHSEKYMRNEIWSLISYFGAPSWFITFSPADNMHPISLYFADTQERFSPELRLRMTLQTYS